ncbi:MAG: efflux RND transporter periplasmic adaptor subunit [Devosia nanyangense]|uniref:Efflux RND transporter periplasmic adaptor subunit n=1 Tax=Devosia nanyangense TaxID=1228055 RepID=A0A933KYP9_9HYPH|nr:efflux RND transporter periplasmic adaptor subunit [Devosia nanyangense]
MRAIYSYGVALVIVLVLAVWLATGTLVTGGKGPGNGEKPVVSLIEQDGGPLTDAVEKSGINAEPSKEGEVDPSKTIAERNDADGNGANAAPRSVRIETISAQNMPIEVPLRGRTKAKASVSVVAQTSGIIQTVSVTKGQSVKAGDVLCTLDQGARKLAVDQAQASVDQAQTAYDVNQTLVKKGLAAPNTALAAEAALAGAKTGLESAQLELARTEIKAGVDGVVEGPLAAVGSMLGMGAPCATVVQLDPMLFIASVPEARIGYAKLGLKASITTVTGDKAEGTVTYIAATADDATRSFPVEIEIPNADGKLRDGITADAVVNVGTAPVHVLRQSVLTLDDEGVLGIRTVEAGNKVAFHPVTIVKDTRDGVWVVGLPFKINVITVGQEFVQPGQIVDAKTADGEQPAS